MSKHSLSVELAGRKISRTFYEWLDTEVKSSGIDNTYLDDFIEARHRLILNYDNDDNWFSSKNESLLNRLEKIWWPPFVEQPDDDEASAKVLFSPLMFVSGTYRAQCYIQAKNPDEYISRRQKVVGINLQRTVVDHLATMLPASGNFSHAKIAVESYDMTSLNERRQEVMRDIGEITMRKVVERLQAGEDWGLDTSPPVQEMQKAQESWIKFATDCVTLAAKLRRGNLSAVPFLEPKSVSAKPAPKVIYPLTT